MPFTVEQFFEVFRRYNDAVWPAQVVAVVDAFIAAGAVRHHVWAPRPWTVR